MGLLKALLGLLGALAAFFRDRQMLDAGRATERAEAQAKVIENVQAANDTRETVRDQLAADPERLRQSDGFKRPD